MSFEGYYQVLCKNGHYSTIDSYYYYDEPSFCVDCDVEIVWENLVDETNGCECLNLNPGTQCTFECGHVELELLKPSNYSACPTCSNKERISEDIFKIPEKCKECGVYEYNTCKLDCGTKSFSHE